MYTIKNAIILAAGLGQRMLPITNKTPKPLVDVCGRSFIERIIDRLSDFHLENIFIVVGHLKDSFDFLTHKYSNINLVYNDKYDCSNNITSVYLLRHYLENSVIIEGDLLIKNPQLLTESFKNTHYKAIPMSFTEDWFFKIDSKGKINEFGKKGENCYQMIGISYWNDIDGRLLSKAIEDSVESGITDIFWDQIPLEYNKDEFSVQIDICSADDVIEIDTLSELCSIDNKYCDMLGELL